MSHGSPLGELSRNAGGRPGFRNAGAVALAVGRGVERARSGTSLREGVNRPASNASLIVPEGASQF